MNILVLAGGLSPERDVSLSSGSLIANALINNNHRVLLVDLYEGIEANPPYDDLFISEPTYSYKIPDTEPDLEKIAKQFDNHGAKIGKNIIELARFADVVFMGLHGDMGENGQLQATFDAFGIKHYTGSDYLSSAMAMDKGISKRIMQSAGVPTAEWIDYNIDTDTPQKIKDTVGFPCVVKPSSCGSSCGVSIVTNESELNEALKYAKKYDGTVLIERKITGREFSCGILDGKALPPIEIIPIAGWYDYKNKYQGGCTKEETPANISSELTELMQEYALKIHNALGLGAYSRVDFLLEESTQKYYCLEVNTLPGMTPTSLLPQEAAAAGINYNQLCELLVQKAKEKRDN